MESEEEKEDEMESEDEEDDVMESEDEDDDKKEYRKKCHLFWDNCKSTINKDKKKFFTDRWLTKEKHFDRFGNTEFFRLGITSNFFCFCSKWRDRKNGDRYNATK